MPACGHDRRAQRAAHLRVAVGLLVVVGGVGVYWRASHQSVPQRVAAITPAALQTEAPEPAANYTVHVAVQPRSAAIEIDGVLMGTGSFTHEYGRDGTVHVMQMQADGYEQQSVTFRNAPAAGSRSRRRLCPRRR